MTDLALEVLDLRKSFAVPHSTAPLQALAGVSLNLRQGETLGIVGESGCGKSTLARLLMMLEKPDSGTIRVGDTVVGDLRAKERREMRRRIQMVFQDPYSSLNERMSVADIIAEPWKSFREQYRTRSDRARRVQELMEMVGLRRDLATKSPRELSGGQRQRVGIARALALDPEILICDEPVSALDLSVQAQVLNVLSDLQESLGISYLFISHNLDVVRHIADRVCVMYLGVVVESATVEEIFTRPRHPYTKALLAAAPRLDGAGGHRRRLLTGELPSPVNPPSGCRFRTRCWLAADLCREQVPELLSRASQGSAEVACHFPQDQP